MRRIAVSLFVFLVFASACVTPADRPQDGRSDLDELDEELLMEESGGKDNKFSTNIKGTEGLLVLSEEYGEGDQIDLYDQAGTLWYSFSHFDEEGFEQLENINTEFQPFAFHPDYLLLALRVTGTDDKRYRVVVNERTGLEKYVLKTDPNFELESLAEHITRTFAVDFDPASNPLLSEPAGEKLKTDNSAIRKFTVAEVDGDWAKVEWNVPAGKEGESATKGSGWVRWKRGDVLLLQLYYFE